MKKVDSPPPLLPCTAAAIATAACNPPAFERGEYKKRGEGCSNCKTNNLFLKRELVREEGRRGCERGRGVKGGSRRNAGGSERVNTLMDRSGWQTGKHIIIAVGRTCSVDAVSVYLTRRRWR